MLELRTPDRRQSHRLRLNTLIRLRWLAIIGQSAAVLIVAYGFDFPLPVSVCFALIAAVGLAQPRSSPSAFRQRTGCGPSPRSAS